MEAKKVTGVLGTMHADAWRGCGIRCTTARPHSTLSGHAHQTGMTVVTGTTGMTDMKDIITNREVPERGPALSVLFNVKVARSERVPYWLGSGFVLSGTPEPSSTAAG
ncbi:hypothetical protein VaNZ11_017025 [Volvox africanus]|uniref:Uncharacterized protein n=1 Tax=Volvox africanus TaxID=51714 RepID=A0ABQ5SQC1_9CHLO|nr:hypothetical protein VaNZ11_017025 [Volvox africanus]